MIQKCKLADLNIEFDLVYDRTCDYLSAYSENFETSDLYIKLTDSDFKNESKFSLEENHALFHNKTLETTAVFRLMAEKLPLFDAAALHSCAFKVADKGIAFGAHSGTGKTTHMLLWKKLLGDNFVVVNGDKPLIRFIGDELYMYGSPWAGKEGLNNNIKVSLTDICKIERSETNETVPLSKEDAIEFLMKQIYMPMDPQMRIKTLELIYRIAEKVKFWKIKCNMELDAAEVAYNTIFEK